MINGAHIILYSRDAEADRRFLLDDLGLMCDDVKATVDELEGKGVQMAKPISDQGWGLVTAIRLPGGDELGLYEPRHPTAHQL